MALLPTPTSMPLTLNGNIFTSGDFRHRHLHHQQQLFLQPYLPLAGDRSFANNYYLVVVPLIGLPSTLAQHIISAAMSTSTIFQASTLLNSLLSTPSLFSSSLPTYANRYPAPASSMVSHIRQQYRYNFRHGYRYVLHSIIHIRTLFASMWQLERGA